MPLILQDFYLVLQLWSSLLSDLVPLNSKRHPSRPTFCSFIMVLYPVKKFTFPNLFFSHSMFQNPIFNDPATPLSSQVDSLPPHSTLPLLLAHSPPISQAVLVSSGPWPWSLCCSGCLPFCQSASGLLPPRVCLLTLLKCWFLSPSLPGLQHQLSNVVTSPFLCISPPHSLTVHLLVDSKGCCDVISCCSAGSIPGVSTSLLPSLSYTSFQRHARSVWHPLTSNLSFLRKALCPLRVFQVWY